MAIYTKRGDRGKTSLNSQERRWKDDQRIISIGSVDELNSHIGFVSSLLASRREEGVKKILRGLQRDLFEIGAELASSGSGFSLQLKKVRKIEKIIDDLEGELPALGNFIFPGGFPAGAALHIARSVSRRTEREVVRLGKKEEVNENIRFYLNRISDLLFMLARKVNLLHKTPEDDWKS